MTYTNPPLDTSDVIKTLKARGLQIADETLATVFLEDVSYFRFAAYPDVDPRAMGFPVGWEQEPLWR